MDINPYKLFFLFIISFNVNANCIENYHNDKFLGCSLQKSDKILNTKWLSTAFNIYTSDINQGITFFEIDKEGFYHGTSIIRKQNTNCLINIPKWTGKIYKLTTNTYAAWNDEANFRSFYLINTSNNYATSFLVAGDHITNVTEKNEFYKKPYKFNINNILKILKPFYCQ